MSDLYSEDVVVIPDLDFNQEYEEIFKDICRTVKAENPDEPLSIAPKLFEKIDQIYGGLEEEKKEEYEYILEAARQILALEMTVFSGLVGAP